MPLIPADTVLLEAPVALTHLFVIAVTKVVRPAQGDTLGRTNVLYSIDRLATPAIRKPALPAVKRAEAGMSPDRREELSPRIISPKKVEDP